RSDKPEEDATYTFDFHRKLLIAFIERLDLRSIAVVCQAWGGLRGLTLPVDMSDRFAGLLVMNTALGTGDIQLTKGFLDWRAYVARTPDIDCGLLLKRTCPHLSDAEVAAYGAPFPDIRFKAGVRRFPQLVPDRLDAPGAAISRRAPHFSKNQWPAPPFLAISMQNPLLGPPVMQAIRQMIR